LERPGAAGKSAVDFNPPMVHGGTEAKRTLAYGGAGAKSPSTPKVWVCPETPRIC
jgi:hypothetical protein